MRDRQRRFLSASGLSRRDLLKLGVAGAGLIGCKSGLELPHPGRTPWLSVTGSELTRSSDGAPVRLRGVNFGHDEAMYYADDSYSLEEGLAAAALTVPGAFTRTGSIAIDGRDYQRLASWGCNCVRFGIDWHWFGTSSRRSPARAAAYAMIDQHVEWAKESGIWLIPTMLVPPGGSQSGAFGGRFYDVLTRFDPASMTPYMALLRDFWVEFARRYDNEPSIAGYDLLDSPATDKPATLLFPYFAFLMDEIRRAAGDRGHFFVVQPAQRVTPANFTDESAQLLIARSDVVYAAPIYKPEALCENGFTYQYPLSNWTRLRLPGLAAGVSTTEIPCEELRYPISAGAWVRINWDGRLAGHDLPTADARVSWTCQAGATRIQVMPFVPSAGFPASVHLLVVHTYPGEVPDLASGIPTSRTTYWDKAQLEAALDAGGLHPIDFGRRHDVPVLVNEFGCMRTVIGYERWTRDLISLMNDTWDVNWCFYEYRGENPYTDWGACLGGVSTPVKPDEMSSDPHVFVDPTIVAALVDGYRDNLHAR